MERETIIVETCERYFLRICSKLVFLELQNMISIVSSKHKKTRTVTTVLVFLFFGGEIRKSNAMRMSIAADGSTEANNNFCRRQKCKRISTLGPKGRVAKCCNTP